MKIGLIADIHGNTVALDAVLRDISGADIDILVCLGDVAANGPDPRGAVERIAELGCPTVKGNTDADLVDMPDWWTDPASVGAPEDAQRAIAISRWCASQLGGEHRRYLASLPDVHEVDLGPGGQLLAFHGSPSSATHTITATTAESDLDEMLNGKYHRVLAGGHTHVPMLRRHRSQFIVNPGSVGLPFDDYGSVGDVAVLSHAAYALVSADKSGIAIEFREVGVDSEDLARSVRASGMPESGWWLGLHQ